MDVHKARLLLKELVVHHLPKDTWLLLLQKDSDDISIAKALGRSCGDIDALLINTGICKETKVRIGFTKTWDTILSNIIEGIHIGNINQRHWYIKIGEGGRTTPANQQKDRIVLPPRSLSHDITRRIRSSNEYYVTNKKKLEEEQKKKEAAKQSKKKVAVAKKKTNITDNYPLLSKLVGETKEISLKDEEIEQLSKSVLTEIVKLYETEQKPLSFALPDGKDMILERLDSSPKKRSRDDNAVSPQPNTEEEVIVFMCA